MAIEMRPLSAENMADALSCDASFVIESELVLNATDGVISYDIRPVPRRHKHYAHSDNRDRAVLVSDALSAD